MTISNLLPADNKEQYDLIMELIYMAKTSPRMYDFD